MWPFNHTGKPRVLNIGGGSKSIPIPQCFTEYEHVLLDIDRRRKPDVLCDARKLRKLRPNQFEAIYCAHNLEHYFRHEVPVVLAGMHHVLKPVGLVYIVVPDIMAALKRMQSHGQDLEDTLYLSNAGPIMTLDVIYGYSVEIERSNESYYAHKTAFTEKSLRRLLTKAGFTITGFESRQLEFIITGTK